jgi:hypothetical protein
MNYSVLRDISESPPHKDSSRQEATAAQTDADNRDGKHRDLCRTPDNTEEAAASDEESDEEERELKLLRVRVEAMVPWHGKLIIAMPSGYECYVDEIVALIDGEYGRENILVEEPWAFDEADIAIVDTETIDGDPQTAPFRGCLDEDEIWVLQRGRPGGENFPQLPPGRQRLKCPKVGKRKGPAR